MSELINKAQGQWPTILSAYQNYPQVFWAAGVVIVAFIVYLATLPRRRRAHDQRVLVIKSQDNATGEWLSTTFPGRVVHRFLSLRVKELSYKGKVIKFDDLDPFEWDLYPANYWLRDPKITNDVAVAAFRRQRRSRQFPLKAIIALAIVVILGLAGWFVVKTYLERRAEPEQTQAACHINESGQWVDCVVVPTTAAPLASKDDIVPAPSTPEPTPDPERIDPFSIVVDLDQPAAPGQLEQMLLVLGDRLPVFPDIIPDWVSFGAARHPVQVTQIQGMEGFVIVFATSEGLELHRTNDQFVKVGETLYLSDYRATLIANDVRKGVGYDVDSQQWLETIDYPRGRVRVLVTQHQNPSLQVVSTGWVYNSRPWHTWAAVGAAFLLIVAIMIWRRR